MRISVSLLVKGFDYNGIQMIRTKRHGRGIGPLKLSVASLALSVTWLLQFL
jgi:hypothetical protein